MSPECPKKGNTEKKDWVVNEMTSAHQDNRSAGNNSENNDGDNNATESSDNNGGSNDANHSTQ